MDIEKMFEASKELLEVGKEAQIKVTKEEANDEENNGKDPGELIGSGMEENTAESSSSPMTASSTPDTSKETFIKFRSIISEYLNEETFSIPEGPAQSVLSSYSLAGYLDHAVPTGKDIVITKLMQQCCFQLQELLK